MGDGEDQEPGAAPSVLEQNEMAGEAAAEGLLMLKKPAADDNNGAKVGLKRARDDDTSKLTSKGKERMKKDPPETRVRPSKQFKDLFAPEKLREFRMPSAQAAAQCEDIVMVWADRIEDPAKRIQIKEDLFNYEPSFYLNDSELLEGLKGVSTAEEMELFLRRRYNAAPMRKPRAPPKRAKKEFVPPAGARADDPEAATPLALDVSWVQALPDSLKEIIAQAPHSSRLEPSSTLQLLEYVKDLLVWMPDDLPHRPPVGSLFCITADGPSLKCLDDGYEYPDMDLGGRSSYVENFEDGKRFSVHLANDANVQRCVYHLGGCDRYLVHYVKQVSPEPCGEAQPKPPPAWAVAAAEKKAAEEAAAAVKAAKEARAAGLAAEEARLESEKRKLLNDLEESHARRIASLGGRPEPSSVRLLAALGARVLAPRVRLERCCDAVNTAFDDLEDSEPQLTAAALRRGALALFSAPFSSLSASHEKNWRMLVDDHPQCDVIYSMAADVVEPLLAEGKAAAALEAAPTYDPLAMARALGVLANSSTGNNRALIELVAFMSSGNAPMDWAVSFFVFIRDAVCRGEMDKAQEWAEMAMANKPVVKTPNSDD